MHVAILGLGPSVRHFLEITKRLGGRHAFCDEVWAINALGDVLACDLVFHMDDVRIQEIRAAASPESNIANMLAWLKKHTGPIMTSRAHPDFPALVEYPLEDVVNMCPNGYLNTTAAHAVAYAILKGAKKISCWGMDFTYPDAHHAEKGRACVEFWLGFASARGIEIVAPKTSSLLDAMYPLTGPDRFYGYDCVELSFKHEGGRFKVAMKDREKLPTAAEIEERYDHRRHPNAIVEDQTLRSGERQVSATQEGIRRDHVARYEWAVKHLPAGAKVLDYGCGVGYGSKILADHAFKVVAVDSNAQALEYAMKHYDHVGINWQQGDEPADLDAFAFDAAVCFEVIEHVLDPRPLLKKLREKAKVLLASVPNETYFPFNGQAFHHRHYTRIDFISLLNECGWVVRSEWGQVDDQADVDKRVGRTIVIFATSGAA